MVLNPQLVDHSADIIFSVQVGRRLFAGRIRMKRVQRGGRRKFAANLLPERAVAVHLRELIVVNEMVQWRARTFQHTGTVGHWIYSYYASVLIEHVEVAISSPYRPMYWSNVVSARGSPGFDRQLEKCWTHQASVRPNLAPDY